MLTGLRNQTSPVPEVKLPWELCTGCMKKPFRVDEEEPYLSVPSGDSISTAWSRWDASCLGCGGADNAACAQNHTHWSRAVSLSWC